jgi:dihydroorotate dehydrogenase electron transfer subunit
MVYALLRMLNDQELKRAWFSLHRYIKCGIGVCGACCIDPGGYRVCRDGPVFCGVELVDSEFGMYKRGTIRLVSVISVDAGFTGC